MIIFLAALLLFLSETKMKPEQIAGVFSNIIAFFYVSRVSDTDCLVLLIDGDYVLTSREQNIFQFYFRIR
nr:unnamed protein product [Callosobruchus chinensis]